MFTFAVQLMCMSAVLIFYNMMCYTFTFVFKSHYETTGKMVKGQFLSIQMILIVIQFFETMVHHDVKKHLNCPLQSYPTNKNHLKYPLTPLPKLYSNYHPSLNSFNDIFIWMKGDDNAALDLLYACLCQYMFHVKNILE